jgi:hypothetical protein
MLLLIVALVMSLSELIRFRSPVSALKMDHDPTNTTRDIVNGTFAIATVAEQRQPELCPPLALPPPKTTSNHTHNWPRPEKLQDLLSTEDNGTAIFPSAERITNLRLAFVGDSITRYQFLSLAVYLRTGQWWDDKAKRNVLNYKSFPSWNDYANYSIQVLGADHHPCDCFGTRARRSSNIFWDNRYYFDSCRGNYLSFVAKLGNKAVDGHWHPNNTFALHDDTELKQDQQPPPPPAWQYETWPDLLRNYVTQLKPKPDYLILNEGKWDKNSLERSVAKFETVEAAVASNSTVLHEIRRILDQHTIHGIYKTTTKDSTSSDFQLSPHDEMGCRVLHSCLLMNWTGMVEPRHYIDSQHFRPHGSRWFNEQLWDHLQYLERK